MVNDSDTKVDNNKAHDEPMEEAEATVNETKKEVEFVEAEEDADNCEEDVTIFAENSVDAADDDDANNDDDYEKNEETAIAIPPDGGWGWTIVFAAFAIFVITEGITFAYGAFFQAIGNELKFTRSQISLIGAAKAASICLSGPFSAALINTYGYRFVGVTGAILASVSTVVSLLNDTIAYVLITFGVLTGIGYGMLYVASVIAVGFYFEKWRSLATGVSLCGAGIGCTIVPPLLTLILQRWGLRIAFAIKGLIVSLCAVCALTFKPLKPAIVGDTPYNSRSNSTKDGGSGNSEEDSNVSKVRFNFFDRYHTASFPTFAETKISSTLTILLPEKSDGCESSVTVFMPKYARRGMPKTLSPLIEVDVEGGSATRTNACCCVRPRSTTCCNRLRKGASKQASVDASMRPLYRDDIFYHGSINLIPEYRRSMQSKAMSTKSKTTNYSMSVSRIVAQSNLQREKSPRVCSKHIKTVLATMLDVRLFKAKYFPLLMLNALFASFGFFTPFLFVRDRGLDNGLTENECFWLISTIGAANTIGRVFSGAIVLLPSVCPIKLTAVLLTIGGITTMVSEISFVVWVQFLFAAIYGLTIASISTLRTIIIVQVLGLSKLTNAMGMIMLTQGVATLLGIWSAGLLRDLTDDYKATFHASGLSVLISGLILFCVRKIPNGNDNTHQNDNRLEVKS